MGKLFDFASEQNVLFAAWRHIRSNGLSSKSEETRRAIEAFDEDPVRNIRSLQSLLRNDTFDFDFQKGILKEKGGGKKRGIVLASVRNRIVERAILDVLQSKCKFIEDANSCPTSVGGVPHRSVPHGLKLVIDAFSDGKGYFARSDISGFFDHIPRHKVLQILRSKISDNRFLSLIERATTVTLSNEKALGEDRAIFPTDDEGVAQGSPLSPLFGNILLDSFDKKLNNEDILCIRFIDDFLILGKSADEVKFAFDAAEGALRDLNLECKNPYLEKCDPAKADFGPVTDKIIFLGHQIEPGLLQPSRDARKELLSKVRAQLSLGRSAIKQVKDHDNSFSVRNRYIQTLDMVDRIISGWAQAFSYCNAINTFDDLDTKINEELHLFREFFRKQCSGLDARRKKRLLGIRLIRDVPKSSFEELPRLIKINNRYVRTKSVTVSTDGSIYRTRQSSGKENLPGGWAYVTHDREDAGAGHEVSTTINRMELMAVVRALEHHSTGPVIIRTDSRYVERTANGKQTTKRNSDLWDRFRAASAGRKIRIDWVKGHSGDAYNEQADEMAKAQARLAAETNMNQGAA